jgi:hypothetical protein
MFATLDPARNIPWTKPEDIVLDDAFPGIGKPAGIGAIHPVEGGHHTALVAFADGSVRTIADSVDTETLRTFLTRNGLEAVNSNNLDGPGAGPADPDRPPMVKVIAADDGREQGDDLRVIHMGVKPKPLEPLLKSAVNPQGWG